jgi:uncharacterized protein YkwD
MDYHDVHSITPCQCPKCRAERGFSGFSSTGGYRSSRSGLGKKVAVIAIIAIVGLGGLLYYNPLDLQGAIFPRSSDGGSKVQANTDTAQYSDNHNDEPTGDTITTYFESPPKEETREEIITLVNTDVIFIGRDAREFEVLIPNEDVQYLRGSIIPEADSAIDVVMIHNGQQITYTVFGIDSQASLTHNRDVRLAVNPGDKVTVLVKSSSAAPIRGLSQDVKVHLYVSYTKTIQTSTSVPVTGAAVETKEVPKSTGTGRNIDPEVLAREVHRLTNERRVQNGLSALDWDPRLAEVALGHSKDMAARDYFDHDTPEGRDPTDRADALGYSCYKDYGTYYTVGIAENLFQHWTYEYITYVNGVPFYTWNSLDQVAEEVVDGWMKSPGHRQNMLTPTYDREGIAVAIASNDKIYVTQNFC